MKKAQWSRFARNALIVLAFALPHPGLAGSEPEYDRLDGHGASEKKVDVIEWENNLEIHVYPAGSLKGLALKLDQRNKDKPVMVIGYRFKDAPSKQLIRRAVLGIPLSEHFQVFKDPSEEEFDKIVISNNGLAAPLAFYKLEPAPTQLYPDGHPMLAQQGASDDSAPADDRETRKPASRSENVTDSAKSTEVDPDDGTVQPFFTRPENREFVRPGGRGGM